MAVDDSGESERLRLKEPFGRKIADGIFDSADESLNGQLEFSSRTRFLLHLFLQSTYTTVTSNKAHFAVCVREREREKETVCVSE